MEGIKPSEAEETTELFEQVEYEEISTEVKVEKTTEEVSEIVRQVIEVEEEKPAKISQEVEILETASTEEFVDEVDMAAPVEETTEEIRDTIHIDEQKVSKTAISEEFLIKEEAAEEIVVEAKEDTVGEKDVTEVVETIMVTEEKPSEAEETFVAVAAQTEDVVADVRMETTVEEEVAEVVKEKADVTEADVRQAEEEIKADITVETAVSETVVKVIEETREETEQVEIAFDIKPEEKPSLPETLQETQPDVAISPAAPELAPEAPRFTQTLQKQLEVFEGSRVTVECVVTGRPTPVITWFKEEVEIVKSERFITEYKDGRCTLTIPSITLDEDALEFTCQAKNDVGVAKTWIEIFVEKFLNAEEKLVREEFFSIEVVVEIKWRRGINGEHDVAITNLEPTRMLTRHFYDCVDRDTVSIS
ncbi:titin-like isoform X2 [Gigantopelta aegis]|uniref:titin-like isoform X2 n=1 Tax=Gigantopelta aegis TaxID=1735272 RepID=UPI001B88D33B|nr:titin-like isoform X2 [Gigantopelta aegis]